MQTVVYLSTGIQDTAFPSQVAAWLRHLDGRMRVRHLSMEPWRQWPASVQRATAGSAGDLLRQLPVVSRATLSIDGRRAASAVVRAVDGDFVVHARGQVNAVRARALERVRGFRGTVADLRGAIVDENTLYRGGGPRAWLGRRRARLFDRIERESVARSRHVVCVSHAFARWLRDRYGLAGGTLTVVPTFVDTARFRFDPAAREATRRELGLDGRFVVAYAGGSAEWQMPQASVALFRAIRRAVPEALLLWLTHRTGDARLFLAGLDPGEYRLLSVAHPDVPRHLCAADAGVLLREPTLTNVVAAPIKFAEYLCCGLPALVSAGIGDTAEQVAALGAGMIVERDPAAHDWRAVADRLRGIDRAAVSAAAATTFGIEHLAPRLIGIYRSCLD